MTISSIIGYLNGKKTAIGAAALTLSCILSKVVVGIWHYDPLWIDNTIQTLEWFGMAMSTVGIGHKIQKSNQDK